MDKEKWEEEEIRASVGAYIEMLHLQGQRKPYVKKAFYRQLANKFGRSEKSYEYRMQNISYVYSVQGREWVKGLKPMSNVGVNVFKMIEKIIADIDNVSFGPSGVFNAEVEILRKRKNALLTPPSGNIHPHKTQSTVTTFSRDPKVVDWVLRMAKGSCECCDKPAPFISINEQPFLEVHHLQRLADGGADTIKNALALCPNCHRELHYGIHKNELSENLKKKIERLE